jgi:beta-galactosidase
MTEVNNSLTQEATKTITHQREVILCDFIARGLALTQRPFTMTELTRSDLNITQTPNLWVMMEKRCLPEVQQKLVAYVNQGGKLILAGRMCVADSEDTPCTILKDALGIQQINSDPPFVQNHINAFQYEDVPATFVESYTGQFDDVFATRPNGDAVGFVKTLGQGKVILFGAAITANTLDDLDILHQMALRLDCQPLFKLSAWVDVRLSGGENGRFLFLNNYQDDPVETTIEYQKESLFDGRPVHIPARQGLILPLEWQLNDNILIHYTTAEITEITEDDATLVLKTRPAKCTAEFTIGTNRTQLHATIGQMMLKKNP